MFRPAVLCCLLISSIVVAKPPEPLPPISEYTVGMDHQAGFLDLFWDADRGKVLLRIDRLDQPLIQVTALAAGVGSNDIGLDRGQLGGSRIVSFKRVGRSVLLLQPNLYYRAESDNPDEVRAVDEAFARSVLATLPVVAGDDEAVLVDWTGYLVSDVHGISARLTALAQGSFGHDPKRSVPLPESLRSFPRNTVAEAMVTFRGVKPADEISSVTPDATALTVRLQHQLVALPEAGFERRPYHPRSGYFPFQYRDYAVPLGQSIDRRVLVRHRLQTDARGQVIEPLVYYVDRGAPEPIRSALMDGAGWWAEAFEAAGFPGGYRVELLPDGVDALDVRYNVIQWVHRSTRGWSYGSSVRDPRSGEIIKGHISLGSLRVRQDMLIAEGLIAPYYSDSERTGEIEQTALARLRQLAAHEVGHTLGLAHNFAASVSNDASVMDYPHPYVRLGDRGGIELDKAYDNGIGEWDKLAIEYGYREFADESARAPGLAEILDRAQNKGLAFISDPDARGFASIHALAHLWDNGEDPLARFTELMQIRRLALDGFDERVLRDGEPYSLLENKLVPVYLVHRYQAEAVAKLAGGLTYDHRMKGDDSVAVRPVSGTRQTAAVRALISAIDPDELRIDAALLATIQPPAFGYLRDREAFTHRTGSAFDAWAPARAATQLISRMLLEPGRAERLEQHHQADASVPGFAEVLEQLMDQRIVSPLNARAVDPLAETIAWVVLRELQRAMVDPLASDRIRGMTRVALAGAARQLARRHSGSSMAAEINRFLNDPDPTTLPPREVVPPGSPI